MKTNIFKIKQVKRLSLGFQSKWNIAEEGKGEGRGEGGKANKHVTAKTRYLCSPFKWQ
uniref:Uncharacterized protein n=1 Tax=Solanum lycopersicum TaxID=4081 RepID=A0A3Q7FIJ5_SOLLC